MFENLNLVIRQTRMILFLVYGKIQVGLNFFWQVYIRTVNAQTNLRICTVHGIILCLYNPKLHVYCVAELRMPRSDCVRSLILACAVRMCSSHVPLFKVFFLEKAHVNMLIVLLFFFTLDPVSFFSAFHFNCLTAEHLHHC